MYLNSFLWKITTITRYNQRCTYKYGRKHLIIVDHTCSVIETWNKFHNLSSKTRNGECARRTPTPNFFSSKCIECGLNKVMQVMRLHEHFHLKRSSQYLIRRCKEQARNAEQQSMSNRCRNRKFDSKCNVIPNDQTIGLIANCSKRHRILMQTRKYCIYLC